MCSFADFLNGSQSVTAGMVDGIVEQFRGWIAGMPKIRVYVEAQTTGTGHIASTCKVILRLVQDREHYGMAYDKRIEVVCEKGGLAYVKQMMSGWIPEIKNEIVRLGNATLELKERDDSLEQVIFGISGGRNSKSLSAASMHTDIFLWLEPVCWDYTDQIHIREEKISLDGTAMAPTAFLERAWYYALCKDAAWETWKGQYPDDINKIKMIETLFQMRIKSSGMPAFQIMPEYLFQRAFLPNWIKWMTNLTGGLLHMQDLQRNGLPVIILSVSDISDKEQIRGQSEFWAQMDQVFRGMECDNDYTVNFLTKERKARGGGTCIRMKIFQDLDAAGRFQKLFPDWSKEEMVPATVQAIETFLNEQEKTPRKKVLFLHVGRVPAALFEYMMCESDLPPIFEGANTANNAVLTGKPYFHRKVQGSQENCFYPSKVLNGSLVGRVEKVLQQIMQMFKIEIYNYATNQMPCIDIGAFLAEMYDTPDNGFLKYFSEIGNLYRTPQNDKLAQAVCLLMAALKERELYLPAKKTQIQRKGRQEETSLDAWYRNLRKRMIIGQKTWLAQALPEENRKLFYHLTGVPADQITIVPKQLERQDEQSVYFRADADGAPVAGMGLRALEITYTQENVCSIRSEVCIWFLQEELSLPGMPWIVFKEPGACLLLSQNLSSFEHAKIIGSMNRMRLELSAPLCRDVFALSARWQKPYPSPELIYPLLGGASPLTVVPPVFGVLDKIGLESFSIEYQNETSIPQAAGIRLIYSDKIVLAKGVELDQLYLVCQVTALADPPQRSVSADLGGIFRIGKGSVQISACFPGVQVNGRLLAGETIELSDLWNQFLSFMPNPLTGQEAVTDLDFLFDLRTSAMSFAAGIDLEWKLAEGLVLTDVRLGLSYEKPAWTGYFQAALQLFTKDSLYITAGCLYGGKEEGWTVAAQMTQGTLKIGKLISEFLGWHLPEEYDYGLKNLRVSASIARKSYAFYAETDGTWAVPFLPEVGIEDVSASVEWGDAKETRAELSGAVDFFGISFEVFLQYAKDDIRFALQWNRLRAVLEKKKECWSAQLSLSGQTLGSMAETFIQWVSGEPESLSPPWDILNKIRLSVFQLIFEFPEETDASARVFFAVDVGPIDLGFARIDQVAMRYETKGEEKGIRLTLIGSFFWNSDEILTDENGAQRLQWDPSRPQDAPAPPGGGNKYFDLRLFAMGQHIQVQGATEQNSVQEIVDNLKVLSAPKQDVVPIEPGGPVTFRADAGWLIAADFGILRVSGEKERPARYFLSMAGIFNDPVLYGIHIKLDGEEAKVLKGLESDLMYRQISDQTGCYSSHITLPEQMRRIQLGVFSITMPSIYFEIYTNGDFYVDVGFPHQQDFSNSFALEAVVPPGIPVTGAAGFYFGKLSSETTELVPKVSNGRFYPVIVFGLGIQAGIGKSIHAGILKAGFSITVFGILEGVIARWLPYVPAGQSDPSQIQDAYYFRLKGSVGVTGRLYGSIDFAILKADLNLYVRLEADISYASYEPIPITVMAVVDVRLSLELKLWLFTITIHLSFYLQIKETFVIENHGTPPWQLREGSVKNRMEKSRFRMLQKPEVYDPCFENFTPSSVTEISLLFAPATSVAGDGAASQKEQKMCIVPLLFLRCAQPIYGENTGELLKQSVRRASVGDRIGDESASQTNSGQKNFGQNDFGQNDFEQDDFECMVRKLTLWLLAAGIGPMDEQAAKRLIVSESYLKGIEAWLSREDVCMTLLPEQITAFLSGSFRLDISLPAETVRMEQSAVIFPALPQLTLRSSEGESYNLSEYHLADTEYLRYLKRYFASLSDTARQKEAVSSYAEQEEYAYSVCSYVFADYFGMLAKQIIRSMLDGLRSFLYVPEKDSSDSSIEEILLDIRTESGADYDAADLFDANGDKELCPGVTLQLAGRSYVTKEKDTLRAITQTNGCSMQLLAQNEENLKIRNLFTYEDSPCLSVPHLSAYRVSGLLEEAKRALAIQKAGAMLSRYLLHGLRLPDGPYKRGDRQGGKEAGMYAVIGQQVMVPDPIQEGEFFVSLEKEQADWITFGGCGQESLRYVLEGENYKNLCTIREYVQSHRFSQQIQVMQSKESTMTEPLQFGVGEMSVWNAQGKVFLSHGNAEGRYLRIWEFSKDLRAFTGTDSSAVLPALYPVKSRFDEAEGKSVETPADCYGFGTKVTLTVRKSVDRNCYEIMGADADTAILLERLLAAEQVGQIVLLYQKNNGQVFESGGSDPMLGITRMNLSTVGRPNVIMEKTDGVQRYEMGSAHILNGKKQFIRLLWEAAVTGRGGFYLHYYDMEQKQPLPDELFDEKKEARIVFLFLSLEAQEDYEQMLPYQNVLVTDVPLQEEQMLLKAYVRELSHTCDGRESLEALAASYLCDIGQTAADNQDAYPAAGAAVKIHNGLYCTRKTTPGKDPAAIAQWFGISKEQLLMENPEWKDWSGPLPDDTALRLPRICLTMADNEKRTIGQLAEDYGICIEQFADSNRDVPGLFAPGTRLVIHTGPFRRHAIRRAGSAGLTLLCTEPEAAQTYAEEAYAPGFLRRQFQILGYSVADNCEFDRSPQGIPAGPTAGNARAVGLKTGRLYAPSPSLPDQMWRYDIELFYGNYVKRADGSEYNGLHRMLQLCLQWQDIFGNRIYSDLDDPGDGRRWNRQPQFTGYTDALYAVSGWPFVAVSYEFGAHASLCIRFSFDKESTGQAGGQSKEIENACETYRQICAQLADPNGVVIAVTSTLLPGQDNLLKETHCKTIIKWTADILHYLEGLREGENHTEPEQLLLSADLDTEKLNKEDIFNLKVVLSICRDRRLVMPGMGLTQDVWKVQTEILPGIAQESKGALNFARQFYRSFYEPAGIHLELAHGPDRKEGAFSGDRLWVVRFQSAQAAGIRIYENAAAPVCYAPAPLSTKLLSLTHVPIYDYSIERGIDFSAPSRWLDATDFDPDEWLKTVLEQLDERLSAAFGLALLLIDRKYGTAYTRQLADAKKQLAERLKNLVMPVFEEVHPHQEWVESIRETCYQEMLDQMKHIYDIRVLLQIPLSIRTSNNTSNNTFMQEEIPPRTFGSICTKEPASGLKYTSPKLRLVQSAPSQPALLHTAVTGGDSSASFQHTETEYDIRCLEHQITNVPGLEGYQKSSWLHFMRSPQDENWPLRIRLPQTELPFVLRSYPALPSLTRQEAVAAQYRYSTDLFEQSCLWDYRFVYAGKLQMQDTVHVTICFNEDSICKSGESPGFLENLAQFVTVYPQMADVLEQTTASIRDPQADEATMETARKAAHAYIQMLQRLSQSRQDNIRTIADEDLPAADKLHIRVCQRDVDGIYEIEFLAEDGWQEKWQKQLVLSAEIDGWQTQIQTDRTACRFFREPDDYLTVKEAVSILERRIVLSRLPVSQCQSACASIFLRRNEQLVPGIRTSDAFVYQTQEARFHDHAVPQLLCEQPVFIADIGGIHQKKELKEHLLTLFQQVRKEGVAIKLHLLIQYSYVANASLGARIRLPVALIVSKDETNNVLAEKAAQICDRKISQSAPQGKQARLEMELTLISLMTREPAGILRFTDVRLDVEDIL